MANYVKKKDIMKRFDTVISVGYCNLQSLLIDGYQDYEFIASHSCTRIHIVDDVAITTGYQPFGNVVADYGVLRKYDAIGRKAYNKYSLYYEQWKNTRYKLLKRFIRETIRLANKPKKG